MKKKEAYEALELNESASEDEIKKAFRKLAAQHHPDKNSGSKESEEKFKQVNTAFQILTGKEQAEDEIPMHTHSASHMDINDIFNMMNNTGFGSPFDSFFGRQNQQRQHNIDLSPIDVFVKLTFEESVLGVEKKVSYQKKNFCEHCQGIGKAKHNAKNCRSCNGTGVVSQTIRNGMFTQINRAKCNACNGIGYIGDDCSACAGVGFHVETVSLNLKIPATGAHEITLSASGKGHSYQNNYGDVLFRISPTFEGAGKYHGFYLDGRDVCTRVRVNLNILLFGGTIKVPVVGENDQDLTIPELTEVGKEFYLNGFGARKYANLPNGKQVISIEVNYPSKDKLSKELLEELNKVYA